MSVCRTLRTATPFICLPLGGCAVLDRGFLLPAGPVAAATRHEFLLVCLVMLFVIAPVLALAPLFAWHYRLSNTRSAYRPQWGFSWPLEGLIWIPPSLIVVGLAFLLWRDTHQLDPYKPLPGRRLDIEAVAMDWKWLFIYPELGIATVNELAAPVDTPIEFKLTSTTVMNSFYIPQLAGQIYAMPGMQTSLAAVINKPGEYDGFSSNYSGAGFSDMHFKFHGLSSADFDKWVQATRADGVALARTNYLELAKPSVREVVHHFNTVDADLFHVILNRCAEPGQMCMDKMVAYDTNRKVPDPICLPKEPVVADADRNRPAKAAAAAR